MKDAIVAKVLYNKERQATVEVRKNRGGCNQVLTKW